MSIKAMQQALDSLDEIRILLWKESRVFSHVHSSIDSLRIAIEDEKRRLLSTPEPTQDDEPVGILRHNGQFELQRMVGIPISQPMKLYEHPAPREFVRLSDEEIETAYGESGHYQTLRPQDRYAVFALARAIEDALEEKNK